MISNKQIDFLAYNQTTHPLHFNFIQQLLVNTTRLLKTNTTAYKLDYFEKMLNYLRAIGLYILSNNLHIKLRSPALTELTEANYSERVSSSLSDFLVHFGIIRFDQSEPIVNTNYAFLLEKGRIDNLIKNRGNLIDKSLTGKEKLIIKDFRFVYDLVQKYNNPSHEFQYIPKSKGRIWERLLKERKLDYEIRLSETLYNLINLEIPHKIISPFDEDYYTESGRNAFKNFTQFRFLDYIKQITANKEKINAFDLGCGYGNYVEVLYKNFPDAFITGIEKNAKVFSSTQQKFQEAKNVKIINDDFFHYDFKKKYDIILMNYVLFYFNFSEKQKIIEKAQSMLSEGGSIVLCQYFPGIEVLKKDIAKMQNDDSFAKRIEMYYSDKILYANTLWNDAVDTFSEAVKWNEFKTIVSGADLYIANITNADPFYYSLFVELKKNGH